MFLARQTRHSPRRTSASRTFLLAVLFPSSCVAGSGEGAGGGVAQTTEKPLIKENLEISTFC